MADSIKGKVEELGHSAAETAKKVGHKVSEGATQAKDWAKETAQKVAHRAEEAAQKGKHFVQEQLGSESSCETGCGNEKSVADIQEKMDVIASCGTKVGVVDHVEVGALKLTKNDSPDGIHHRIPASWVDHVDTHVHLNINSEEVARDWQPA